MTELPTGWSYESLDSLINRGIIKLNRGDIISKRDIAANPGEYPIYSSAKENNGMFGRYGKYMFDEEVITWSIDGGGKLFHREKHKFSVTNVGGIMRILDKKVFDYRFLYYALSNLHSQVIFDWSRKAHPSVIRLVYDKIPIPPLPEQQKIVEILEDHLSRLDAALADVKQAKVKAAQFRRSLLQAAFTGNLSGDGTRLMTELPDGWKTVRFGDTFKVRYGKAIDKALRKDSARYPVVGSAGIMTYTDEPLTKEPTIVIGRKGNVGSIQIFEEGCYPIDTTYYMQSTSQFNIKFLTLLLTSLELVKLDSSTATPSLRREDLENVSFFVPPLPEQQKIVEILEDHLSRLDASVAIADLMEKQSSSLRRSLLQAAFTGQLTKEVASV